MGFFTGKETPDLREAKQAQAAWNRAMVDLSPLEAERLNERIAEKEQERLRTEAAERRIAEQQMEQPPDWLRQARSPQRLKVANSGVENFPRYHERLLRVQHLTDWEAQYRGALARKDQARADVCLLRIARLQEQLSHALDAEPVLTGRTLRS